VAAAPVDADQEPAWTTRTPQMELRFIEAYKQRCGDAKYRECLP
jgi:hypothetical protein